MKYSKSMKTTRVLSFGAGRNSCYLLLRHPELFDVCLFADVADGKKNHEEKITYKIIDKIIKPFCQKNKIQFVSVSKELGLLYWAEKWKMVPQRYPRWCSERFKIKPIHQYYRKTLHAAYKSHKIIESIGFTIDESHRMKFSDKNPKYLEKKYPLIEMKITQQKCIDWLCSNYPTIQWTKAKSGCYFCPFKSNKSFAKLTLEQKQTLIKIEKLSGRTFKNKPMGLISHADSDTLDSWCDEGYCMT